MKLFSIIIAFFTFNFNTIYTHDLRTPKGSFVTHSHPEDTGWYDMGEYHTAEEWTTISDQYYGHLVLERLERANNAYNCHAYAWAGSRQANSTTWCKIDTQEDVYWNDGSYLEDYHSPWGGPPLPHATHVSYGTYEHSLIKYGFDESEQKIIVISKWGRLPLYKHYLYSDPYEESPEDVTL